MKRGAYLLNTARGVVDGGALAGAERMLTARETPLAGSEGATNSTVVEVAGLSADDQFQN
jgi:hypothetical protein